MVIIVFSWQVSVKDYSVENGIIKFQSKQNRVLFKMEYHSVHFETKISMLKKI